MDLGVIAAGYVGLVSAACLAKMQHHVVVERAAAAGLRVIGLIGSGATGSSLAPDSTEVELSTAPTLVEPPGQLDLALPGGCRQ